jgi:nucleoside phosphorylase
MDGPIVVNFAEIMDFVIKNGLALVAAVWFFYAVVVSDPPKFVPWWVYQRALNRIADLEEKTERQEKQLVKAVGVTGDAVKVVEKRQRPERQQSQ